MKNNWTRVLKSSEQEAKQHLRNLIYQVSNGGALQYCSNRYADDLLQYIETHDIVEELEQMGCPIEGMEAMDQMIKCLQDSTPSRECTDCGGSGEWENEDENGDVEFSTCETCRGDGYIEEYKWADTDEKSWMDRYDNWFYKLDMSKLDDWTEQSHNHSKFMDAIENDEDYIGNEL